MKSFTQFITESTFQGQIAVIDADELVNTNDPDSHWLISDWKGSSMLYLLVKIGARKIIVAGSWSGRDPNAYGKPGDTMSFIHTQTRRKFGPGEIVAVAQDVRNLPPGKYKIFSIK